MRLLSANSDGSFSLTSFFGKPSPSYAILSHTWEADDQEVTFHDLTNALGSGKRGYRKIQFCNEQAKKDGLQYFWVDSCCIDKSSSAELSQAINSMFRWYKNAANCYVYLSDVSTRKPSRSSELLWEPAFKQSRWFTRGWTLQELLAPRSVEFFSRDGEPLGTKDSLEQQIYETTGIAIQALQGHHLSQFSYDDRKLWAANRKTTIEEDEAYCLLGIFDVNLSLIYGEGKERAFRRLQAEISTQVNWSDKERECMQALRASAFHYEQFKDRNPDRREGTCQWVLQHENFRNWKESSSSRLLWISADPGCGKSVLSKSLVDEDVKNTDTRTTCYFFFKDDNDAQKDIATALSALLHQLIQRKPKLIQHAMSGFAANGDKLPQSFHTLWDILKNTVADPEAGEVFFILDALDECAEAGRYQIISALGIFYQHASSRKNASQLKMCITSRPYPDIERRFTDLTTNFPTIRLRGEHESDIISHEIDLVIKWRVSQLGSELRLNNSERSNLETELLRMTNRTYLWLTLIFDIIREMNRPTSRKLKAAISNLPSTVDEVYEAILARVKEDDRPQARKLLYIIVGATRPLTIQEMNIALAIEDHHRSYDDLKPDLDDEARFEASVRHLCGLFVTVVDQKVYLIHQTAKEFLLAKNEVAVGKWKHSLIPMESEILMARICVVYLSFTEFDRATDHESAAGKYNYLEYAAGSWASHYRKSQYGATEQMLQLVLRVCDTQSVRFNIWFDVYWTMAHRWQSIPRFTSPVTVGSYFGHEVMVKLLLEANADVDLKDNDGRTPLSWAAENGHEGIVKLLLKANADVDSKDDDSQTPLSWAAENGHEGIVKLLLKANADVDSKDDYGWTPLLWTARNGNKGIVKLLLEANADVDLKDNVGRTRTPLSLAAENGHEDIVKLLLEANADVNTEDDDSRTPLSLAAENGHEDIVKLLLEANADVDLKDNDGRTPLSWAAENGHEDIVKILFEANTKVDLKDNYGYTPLLWAARNGHEDIVKILFEANTKVDLKDNYGYTPLLWAARNGYEGIVKLLLEANADVDSKDADSRTPLSWAAKNGHEGIVKLLLKANINVDLRDDYGKTPLSWAAGNGHEGIVKLLESFSATSFSASSPPTT